MGDRDSDALLAACGPARQLSSYPDRVYQRALEDATLLAGPDGDRSKLIHQKFGMPSRWVPQWDLAWDLAY